MSATPFQPLRLPRAWGVNKFSPRTDELPGFGEGGREADCACSRAISPPFSSPSGFGARFMEIKKLRVARGRFQSGHRPDSTLPSPSKALSSKEFPDSIPERIVAGRKIVCGGGSGEIGKFPFELSKIPPLLSWREQYLVSKVLI